jgi:hypothetical protein
LRDGSRVVLPGEAAPRVAQANGQRRGRGQRGGGAARSGPGGARGTATGPAPGGDAAVRAPARGQGNGPAADGMGTAPAR